MVVALAWLINTCDVIKVNGSGTKKANPMESPEESALAANKLITGVGGGDESECDDFTLGCDNNVQDNKSESAHKGNIY